MNTHTPRQDNGQFKSWDSRVNEGRAEGALCAVIGLAIVAGLAGAWRWMRGER